VESKKSLAAKAAVQSLPTDAMRRAGESDRERTNCYRRAVGAAATAWREAARAPVRAAAAER
jgi:hypothetical protein